MKPIMLCSFLLLCFVAAIAQESKHVETDRPNETEVPYITPRKFFQFETGVRGETESHDKHIFTYPELLAKYGLSDNLEFRLKTGYATRVEQFIPRSKTSSGLQPLELGIKAALLKEKRWMPKTALLLETGIPKLGTGEFKATYLAPTARLLMENNVTEAFSINYNAGLEWDGYEKEPQWMYSIVPGIDLGEHIHVFAEMFAFLQNRETPEYTVDSGLEYFIGKNIALDVCSGVGISQAASPFFLTVGGSIRFR